jgi:hypothetical protein
MDRDARSPGSVGRADVVETAPFVDAVRSDMLSLSGKDEASLDAAERLGHALESSLQLRLFDALGQAALELSEQLPAGRVDVRLAGRDVELVFAGEAPDADDADTSAGEGDTARLTLRMPGSLKDRVEDAARRDGISTNAWLVRSVNKALDRPSRKRTGNRITGFARS